jgi:UDP-glucose 4-epimerase
MSKDISVLVVGGAGYIGSHIVHDLVEQGYKVLVLDNLSTGYRENVPDQAELIVGDLTSISDLEKVFKNKIDVVFHFAAKKAVGESMEKPFKYSKNNLTGTFNILEQMHKNGTKKFIFSSSAAVYGSPQYLPIDEEHPTNPENYYGYTKLAIEENLKWFSQITGINYVVLRYFNATGYDMRQRVPSREKEPANLSPIIMEVVEGTRDELKIFGGDYDTPDGTCIRDYIHVNDLASAHLLAMEKLLDGSDNLVLNLGTESGTSVKEMVESAEKALNTQIPHTIVDRRPGDPANLVASSEKAKKILGWEAKHSDIDNIFKTMKSVYNVK